MVRLFAVALITIAGVVRADPASAPGQPPAGEPVAEPEVASTSAEVFVYPAQGQSDKQLDRDRYECHKWSVTQSGYDPSGQAQPAAYQPTPVVRLPPRGIDNVAGVISGAFTGAVLAGPYDTSEGAMIGAIAGGIMGAITESARRKEAGQINAHQGAQSQAERARIETSVSNYRRAISACLEGRGYTVK